MSIEMFLYGHSLFAFITTAGKRLKDRSQNLLSIRPSDSLARSGCCAAVPGMVQSRPWLRSKSSLDKYSSLVLISLAKVCAIRATASQSAMLYSASISLVFHTLCSLECELPSPCNDLDGICVKTEHSSQFLD